MSRLGAGDDCLISANGVSSTIITKTWVYDFMCRCTYSTHIPWEVSQHVWQIKKPHNKTQDLRDKKINSLDCSHPILRAPSSVLPALSLCVVTVCVCIQPRRPIILCTKIFTQHLLAAWSRSLLKPTFRGSSADLFKTVFWFRDSFDFQDQEVGQ